MLFRQLGILLMLGGFLAGHLMTALAQRENTLVTGGLDPHEAVKAAARALTFTIWGDAIALVGLVIYFYGVLTYRGRSNTAIA